MSSEPIQYNRHVIDLLLGEMNATTRPTEDSAPPTATEAPLTNVANVPITFVHTLYDQGDTQSALTGFDSDLLEVCKPIVTVRMNGTQNFGQVRLWIQPLEGKTVPARAYTVLPNTILRTDKTWSLKQYDSNIGVCTLSIGPDGLIFTPEEGWSDYTLELGVDIDYGEKIYIRSMDDWTWGH